MARITSTQDASSTDGVKVLVYSEPGAGKTVLCASAPAPFIISAESGMLSLRKKNIERVYGVGTAGISYEIPVMQISTMDDLGQAYEAAINGRYGTICLDSLSEIAETVLANEKFRNKDPRKAYGEMMDIVTSLIRSFRDIKGKHVYMTAKIEAVKDELTGAVRWGPSLPGAKMGGLVPYYFDEVWRMIVAKNAEQKLVRYMQTSMDQSSTAKDRSGALDMYEPAHLGHCFSKILGD